MKGEIAITGRDSCLNTVDVGYCRCFEKKSDGK